MQIIQSKQNSKYKNLVKFINKKGKTSRDLLLVENVREIERGLDSGLIIKEVYLSESIKSIESNLLKSINSKFEVSSFIFSEQLFNSLSYKEKPDGIKVLFEFEFENINTLIKDKSPILILESIEKPGNLGALLRTADGAGFSNVILLDSNCNINNPNVFRASTGAVFNLNISTMDDIKELLIIKKDGYQIVAADPNTDSIYFNAELQGQIAIVVGNENKGLSNEMKEYADKLVKIPMLGIADSLNVAQAGTIMMYESQRQRIMNSINL